MVEMELLIHSQTSTASPMKLGNEQGISSHFYNGRNYLSLLGFKLIIMSSVKWSPCDILLWWRLHDSSCYCKGFRGCRELSDYSRFNHPQKHTRENYTTLLKQCYCISFRKQHVEYCRCGVWLYNRNCGTQRIDKKKHTGLRCFLLLWLHCKLAFNILILPIFFRVASIPKGFSLNQSIPSQNNVCHGWSTS